MLNALLVAAGLAMLYFGSEWLVRGSVNIARKMRISQLVIGLTIVAFGTSTPELVVSIGAALDGRADISLGNVVGSNIINIGLILGLSAAIFPLAVSSNTIRKEVPLMIAASIALVILSMFDNKITQLEGALMVMAIISFNYFSYRQSRKEAESNKPTTGSTTSSHAMPIEEITETDNTAVPPRAKDIDSSSSIFAKSIPLILLALVLLYFGATLTVDNAVVIATAAGISERVVGLTIVAVGTSLPELITSVIAARKKHTDLSVGNIIGSNLFNVLAVVGISSTIAGISVNPDIFSDYAIMIGFSLILIPLMRSGFILSRIEGICLVIAYLTYVVMLLLAPDILTIT